MLSLGLNFNESDVVALIGADEFAGIAGLIAENDFNGLGFLNDVKIGEDVAFLVDYETGAGAFDGDRIHEEIVFGGFGENVGDGGGDLAIDAHIDGFLIGERGVAGGHVDGSGGAWECAAWHGAALNWCALIPTRARPGAGG